MSCRTSRAGIPPILSFLVETLADGVLWDSDYELQQTLDIPRETSQELKDHLGIDDDYFKVIPLNPLDDQMCQFD